MSLKGPDDAANEETSHKGSKSPLAEKRMEPLEPGLRHMSLSEELELLLSCYANTERSLSAPEAASDRLDSEPALQQFLAGQCLGRAKELEQLTEFVIALFCRRREIGRFLDKAPEFAAVVGGPGIGKTTLVNNLWGHLARAHAYVTYAGRDASEKLSQTSATAAARDLFFCFDCSSGMPGWSEEEVEARFARVVLARYLGVQPNLLPQHGAPCLLSSVLLFIYRREKVHFAGLRPMLGIHLDETNALLAEPLPARVLARLIRCIRSAGHLADKLFLLPVLSGTHSTPLIESLYRLQATFKAVTLTPVSAANLLELCKRMGVTQEEPVEAEIPSDYATPTQHGSPAGVATASPLRQPDFALLLQDIAGPPRLLERTLVAIWEVYRNLPGQQGLATPTIPEACNAILALKQPQRRSYLEDAMKTVANTRVHPAISEAFSISAVLKHVLAVSILGSDVWHHQALPGTNVSWGLLEAHGLAYLAPCERGPGFCALVPYVYLLRWLTLAQHELPPFPSLRHPGHSLPPPNSERQNLEAAVTRMWAFSRLQGKQEVSIGDILGKSSRYSADPVLSVNVKLPTGVYKAFQTPHKAETAVSLGLAMREALQAGSFALQSAERVASGDGFLILQLGNTTEPETQPWRERHAVSWDVRQTTFAARAAHVPSEKAGADAEQLAAMRQEFAGYCVLAFKDKYMPPEASFTLADLKDEYATAVEISRLLPCLLVLVSDVWFAPAQPNLADWVALVAGTAQLHSFLGPMLLVRQINFSSS